MAYYRSHDYPWPDDGYRPRVGCCGPASGLGQFATNTYTVRRGDSLSAIAARHGLTLRQLLTNQNVQTLVAVQNDVCSQRPLQDPALQRMCPQALPVTVMNWNLDLIFPGTVLVVPAAPPRREEPPSSTQPPSANRWLAGVGIAAVVAGALVWLRRGRK